MTSPVRTFVHVFATFGAGGPQVRAVQLMAHLGAGYRHVVMAMDGHTEASAQLPAGLDVEFAPPPARRWLPGMVRAQRRWLARGKPDLVLTYNWGAIESVLAARSPRLPLVHHEDGFLPDEAQQRLRRRNWLRTWALRSVPVIVPSRVLQDIAMREWRLPATNVHHLDNGVDLRRFAKGTAGPAPLRVGTVGGLRPEKDHGNLLRAFAAGGGTSLLQIVGGGALAGELRALAAQLGITSRVEFTGPVTDTARIYPRLDVFVLSSRTEQMPLALLEAMACGCAVVATDVGDVRAILPDVAQPFVVPPENPAALASALRSVLADADLRARLGAANRQRVEERYEARTCLDRFTRVYTNTMASRGE